MRVMQEIIERRFRWNMRQVLATIQETRSVDDASSAADAAFIKQRLDALGGFFRLMDATAGMLAPGRPFPPQLTSATVPTAGDAGKTTKPPTRALCQEAGRGSRSAPGRG